MDRYGAILKFLNELYAKDVLTKEEAEDINNLAYKKYVCDKDEDDSDVANKITKMVEAPCVFMGGLHIKDSLNFNKEEHNADKPDDMYDSELRFKEWFDQKLDDFDEEIFDTYEKTDDMFHDIKAKAQKADEEKESMKDFYLKNKDLLEKYNANMSELNKLMTKELDFIKYVAENELDNDIVSRSAIPDTIVKLEDMIKENEVRISNIKRIK